MCELTALEARLAAALEREKTVAPGHAVLAKAVADAREETMQVKTRLGLMTTDAEALAAGIESMARAVQDPTSTNWRGWLTSIAEEAYANHEALTKVGV